MAHYGIRVEVTHVSDTGQVVKEFSDYETIKLPCPLGAYSIYLIIIGALHQTRKDLNDLIPRMLK